MYANVVHLAVVTQPQIWLQAKNVIEHLVQNGNARPFM